ncbi:MAG: hypothetical protein KC912_12200 [Proteobacteria bacterium]|nr:hypothetical protein [Pseudomonadota bacterium]
MTRALIGVCALIALIDLAQVPLLGKGLGAIGGAAIYGVSALMLARGERRVWPLIAAMPLIPTAVFLGLLGEEVRDQLVDVGMIGVFLLQLAAAGLAVAQRFSASHRGSSQGEAS